MSERKNNHRISRTGAPESLAAPFGTGGGKPYHKMTLEQLIKSPESMAGMNTLTLKLWCRELIALVKELRKTPPGNQPSGLTHAGP